MLSKRELKRQVGALLADAGRGISKNMFAQLCGVDEMLLEHVFVQGDWPMSETVQRRVGRAYDHWKSGMVRVMRRRDQTRYVDYRKQALPPIHPGASLRVTPAGITLRVGPVNRHDYSEPSLFEAMR